MNSDCNECGQADIGGTHACKTMDVACHMYMKLQAKYDIALNYIKRIKDFGNCHCMSLAPQLGADYHHVTCRWRAEQILKELGHENCSDK
jgi:hypothetical protein